jgi:hypothetical protein
MKDNTRYFYSYCAKDYATEAAAAFQYKRFALSDEKDFDALFFPTKNDLLNQLAHFKVRPAGMILTDVQTLKLCHRHVLHFEEQDRPLRHQGIGAQAG